MSSYHLAQLNIAKMKFPLDSPQMADFVDNLERINALADHAHGFVWRLQTPEGDATSIDFFGYDTIVNMSVWVDVKSLHDYVYKTMHAKIMSRRKQWFNRLEDAYSVLWWIPAGTQPTLTDAKHKLALLQASGPGPDAFTFKKAFPAPGNNQADDSHSFSDLCPAT